MELPLKRSRKLPCDCILYEGAYCDDYTVHKHQTAEATLSLSSDSLTDDQENN